MNVKFPDHAWARLVSIAEKREMSVSDLLVEAAEDLLGAPRRERKRLAPIEPTKVAELHSQGLSDRRIALVLDASEGGVRYRRIQLGLPANGRKDITNV
ncbi:hypothetical protein ACFVU2_21175 [Leifsonia sp. NPDC058194]|uniref:hypothetical protein n=1 Tax=Leifsonia sp. NPDC058194 TaxID=3346374 RepID=UPI0036DE6EBC